MGRCPGALGGSPLTGPSFILALVSSLFVPLFSIAGEDSSIDLWSVPEKIEVHAERITAFDDDTVTAEGSVSFRAGDRLITARRALFDLKEKKLSLDSPNFRGLGFVRIFSARGDILANGTVLLAAPVFSHTLFLEAESARCDNLGCRIDTAHVFLCPGCCDEVDLALSARRIVIHPSEDIDLYDPTILLGKEPLLTLPFFRLRPQDRPAFFPPLVGVSPTAGILFGVGGRIPFGPSRTAEGMVIARSRDGFQTRTVLTTPHGIIDLAHLSHLPSRQHALAFQGDGQVRLARTQLSFELNGASSAAWLDELYRDPQKRALGPRASIATARFPGSFAQLETTARFLQQLDGSEAAFGQTGALALVLSLPSHPLFLNTVFVDAHASLYRHFDNVNADDGGWNRTVTTAETEAFLPFRIGIIRGSAEVSGTGAASFVDRSQRTGRMVASRLGLNLELPLLKKTTKDSRHIVPFIRYDLYPFLWSSLSFPQSSRLDTPPGRVAFGLRSSLRQSLNLKRWDARLAFVAESSHFSDAPMPSYAYLRLVTTGSGALSATAQTAYDLRSNKPSLVAAQVSIFFDAQTVLELGAGYLNRLRGPHTHPDWTRVLPSQGLFYPIQIDARLHAEISERLRFPLTRNWSAHVLSRSQVWPVFSFLVVGYGLNWQPRCGCLVVSIDALHRPDTGIPEVMASLELKMN